jgi:hypothetical protein
VQNWYDGANEKRMDHLRARGEERKRIDDPRHQGAGSAVSGDLVTFRDSDDNGVITDADRRAGSSVRSDLVCTRVQRLAIPDNASDGSPPPSGQDEWVAEFRDQRQSLGRLLYDLKDETLVFENDGVALARKILLLGFSSKTRNAELVGQFGEGLKVGILALLREGKTVQMETGFEVWVFKLLPDPNFGGELVLSVEISIRGSTTEVDLSRSDELRQSTVTTIGNMPPAEWASYRKDFLFLSTPAEKDIVRTATGNMILDPEFLHQLYVKQFWVMDMEQEGLHFGVDLRNTVLDRDRRAVVKKSEIDKAC